MDYFALSVLFLVAVFLFELWLNLRERVLLRATDLDEVTPEQKRMLDLLKVNNNSTSDGDKDGDDGEYTDAKFRSSQAYKLEQQTFSILRDVFNITVELAFLFLAVLPALWTFAASLIARHGFGPENTHVHALCFSALLIGIEQVQSIPWAIYSTFVIEEKHGFNKTTPKTFVLDIVKSLVLTAILGSIFLSVILFLVEWGGERFWIYAWGATAAITALMVPVTQYIILPLFFELTPLPEGELRTKVDELVEHHSFPASGVYEIDGSKRSSHSNAFFIGLFTKQICLFDTLQKQCSNAEILAILGHEIGHWKMGHTRRLMAANLLQTGFFFYVFSRFVGDPELYEAFGFPRASPAFVGLLLFSKLWEPIAHVSSFAMNSLTRLYEYEADEFAAESAQEVKILSLALLKIHIENKATLWSDKFYSAYHHNHPTCSERLGRLEQIAPTLGKKKD